MGSFCQEAWRCELRKDWISPYWQAALIPEKWDLCGFTVTPLSVWHTLALESVGNVYMMSDRSTVSMDDACSLILFATRDYKAGKALFEPQRERERARATRRIIKRLKGQDWDDIHAQCEYFVDSCTRSASRWQKSVGGKVSGVFYQWSLVHVLSGGGDATKLETAWNTPFVVARCIFDAKAQYDGDDSVMSPAAQDMEDNWDEYKDIQGTKKVRIA